MRTRATRFSLSNLVAGAAPERHGAAPELRLHRPEPSAPYG